MNEGLIALFVRFEEILQVGFLVFLRVGAAMALLPVVGERSVPGRLRLILAFAFTAVVSPTVILLFSTFELTQLNLIILIFSEIVAGLAVGLSLRLFVQALQIAGSIVAQSTSLSQLFGGAGADPQPAIGHLLVVGGLALAVTFGLHVKMAELLIYSYQIISPGTFIVASEFSSWGVAKIQHAFELAFSLAAPFMIASIVYNIALGAINRAMPQLMVSFVGAPAITCGGLLLLFVAAPLMLQAWLASVSIFLENPFGSIP